jgi:hypothetical protein
MNIIRRSQVFFGDCKLPKLGLMFVLAMLLNQNAIAKNSAFESNVPLENYDVNQYDSDEDNRYNEEYDSDTSRPFVAIFNLKQHQLPYPTDLYFAGSKDGTVNMPADVIANRPAGASVNHLDGFSTTAPLTETFSAPIDPTSLTPETVMLLEVCLAEDTTLKNCANSDSPLVSQLLQGTDYAVAVASASDTGGKVLQITPLKPLKSSTGTTRRGYMVVLTKGIRDIYGHKAHRDYGYEKIRKGLSRQDMRMIKSIGVSPGQVVLTFSFTTQSTNDTLDAVAANISTQAITAFPTGISTAMLLPGSPGKANIYVGTLNVPYYGGIPSPANPTAPLSQYWVAAGPSPVPGIDPLSTNLTRFNPTPAVTKIVTIPLFMTVPNANSNCLKPANGYPVAIIQHGITGDRVNAVTMADAFASACFAVAAIDLPLHGITNPTNGFYQGPNERTFNLDLVNNATGAPGPDGVIDSSGAWFINLTSPLTSLANIRQGEVDLMTLEKALPTLKFPGDQTPAIDGTKMHFVGLSLGSIVGGTHLSFSQGGIKTATLSVPGGVISQILTESLTFGPLINPALQSLYGFTPGTTGYSNYLRDVQTAIDASDPINHLKDASNSVSLVLHKVIGDTVIPNNSTDRLVVAADLQPLCSVGAYPAITAGKGAYVSFVGASHGSLFDPSFNPLVTFEMQMEAVDFANTSVMKIFNATYVDQAPCQ